MPDAVSVEFEVERFERVDASSGTALLRLSGAWTGGEPGPPELVVDDGEDERVVAALPDPRAGETGTEVRAAFPVPTALIENGSATFSVRAEGAGSTELPRPARRRPGAPRARRGPSETHDRPRPAPDAEEVRERLSQYEQRVAAAEERAAEAEELRAGADALKELIENQRRALEEERTRLADAEAIAQQLMGDHALLSDELERARRQLSQRGAARPPARRGSPDRPAPPPPRDRSGRRSAPPERSRPGRAGRTERAVAIFLLLAVLVLGVLVLSSTIDVLPG